MTNYHYWQYFLSLETDLITTSRFIEFSGVDDVNIVNNGNTFSTELLRIFFISCAECENILKILATRINLSTNPRVNIKQLRDIIMNSDYRTLSNQIISCPAYNLDLKPWYKWNIPNNSPQWWTDHNSLKHGRSNDNNSNYHLANLSNTLNSVAALMCLLYEYYKKEINDNEGEYSVSIPTVLAPKLFIPKVSGLGFGNENWVWQPQSQL